MVTRTFIYGGCVSRDTYRYLGEGFSLTRYVARQSAISAMSPSSRTLLAKLTPLDSAFQWRMVDWDLRSTLVRHLTHDARDTDLLLIDLNVERLGVLPWGKGFVTRSNEFWNAGGGRPMRGVETISLGGEQHFELWAEAWRRLTGVLDELGLKRRSLLLETPWASHMDDGTLIPIPVGQVDPSKANEMYARYYAHVESLGVPSITLPDDLAISHAHHQWGPSPYHYVDAAYEWLAAEIKAAVGREASGTAGQ